MSEASPLRNRALGAVAVLALYGVGAVLLTLHTWTSPTTHWIGSCCDPEQTIWFLSWVPYAVGHGINPFISHQINYPSGVNLTEPRGNAHSPSSWARAQDCSQSTLPQHPKRSGIAWPRRGRAVRDRPTPPLPTGK
jgi:hypothetical protein